MGAYDKREYAYGILNAGADGYLRKDEANISLLSEALNSIIESTDPWLSPTTSTKLVQALIIERHTLGIIDSLSDTER